MAKGHARHWTPTDYGDGPEDAYDPFNPAGPWTVGCKCGWSAQAITKRQGAQKYRWHLKRAEGSSDGQSQSAVTDSIPQPSDSLDVAESPERGRA